MPVVLPHALRNRRDIFHGRRKITLYNPLNPTDTSGCPPEFFQTRVHLSQEIVTPFRFRNLSVCAVAGTRFDGPIHARCEFAVGSRVYPGLRDDIIVATHINPQPKGKP